MGRRLTDLYRKVHYGAIMPWDCIILGHKMRPHPAGHTDPLLSRHGKGWWYCTRPGCTHEAVLKKMI